MSNENTLELVREIIRGHKEVVDSIQENSENKRRIYEVHSENSLQVSVRNRRAKRIFRI